jgi:LPS sulfotransferase NodH
MPRKTSYIICTTARSGSNLLCDYLGNTGLLGHPIEFFNPKIVSAGVFDLRFPHSGAISISSYVAWLKTTFRSANGILGIKLLYEDFELLSGFPAFQQLLQESELIYLSRANKISQAVSYFLAEMTGQWISEDPPIRRRDEVEYDFARIREIHQFLTKQELGWRDIFAAMSVAPYNIEYPSYCANPGATLRGIGALMDITMEGARLLTSMVEQKGTDNARLSDKYRRELRASLFANKSRVDYAGLQMTS